MSNMKSSYLLGFDTDPWILSKKSSEKASTNNHQLIISADSKLLKEHLLKTGCPDWAVENYFKTPNSHQERLSSQSGYVWAIFLSKDDIKNNDLNMSKASAYAIARDLVGVTVKSISESRICSLKVESLNLSESQLLGSLVGLELGAYRYKKNCSRYESLPQLELSSSFTGSLSQAANLASGINLARHLVNAPAADLNPKSYAQIVSDLFKDQPGCKVTVLDDKQILEDGMQLLYSVGKAAEHGSKLIHISYRSANAKNKRPFGFVGKGITFDTGGLDLKISGGMRLMKKDMGGSASVVGLAYFVSQAKLPLNCDFYLAVAENAVSATAMRPGDILKARNGLQVEIHNTDAEGRLVIADVMDYAQQKDNPEYLFVVATLTGAMRIAVGTDLIGMFANNDALAESLKKYSFEFGDPAWLMPLYSDYNELFRSSFADFTNSAAVRYAGGITAALFLQRFVKPETKWAHFDMMAYNEKPRGAITQDGGNGQAVQALAGYLLSFSN